MSNFWFNNPKNLSTNLIDFFPSSVNTHSENLNSIVRLCFYISLILAFYHKNFSYFYIFILSLIFTLYIYKTSTISKDDFETLTTKSDCVKPTLSNPFMNPSYIDFLENPNRPPACDIDDSDIKKSIDDGFNNNLFKDTSDIFNKFNSQRQFYTVPNTTIPNDRESYQNWLYKSGPTCKESSDACLRYEDIRFKAPIFYNNLQNPE